MFDTAKPDFPNLEGVLDQLRQYLQRLVRLSDSARIGDLFGLEAQNWIRLGREAGLNDRSKANTIGTIQRFFDSGFQDAKFVLQRAAKSREKWDGTIQARRQKELDGLQAEIDRLRADADPVNPSSLVARERRRLDEYRYQLELATQLTRLQSDADQRAAADARLAAERLQAHGELEKTRIAWNVVLYQQYQSRAKGFVEQLNKLKSEIADLDPVDEDFEIKRRQLDHKVSELTGALENSPEIHAMEGAKRLLDATRVSEAPRAHEPQPPKWWRFRLAKYRPLLWASLMVAILGEQLVMQQLTGRYLGLQTVPRILDTSIPEHLLTLGSAEHVGGVVAVLSRLLGDGLNLVLALVFGSIPLLLSFPVRYYLDRCDEAGEPPVHVAKVSIGAIAALLLSLGVIAFIEGIQQAGGLASGIAKGVALPSLTLVLITGAGWVMHMLFTEGSKQHYHDHLREQDLERHRKRIAECEARIDDAQGDIQAGEARLLAAEHRHAADDSFAAGIGDGNSLSQEVFTAAADAAVRAFESGYDQGVRARQLGVDLKDGETDTRGFDDLIRHITNVSMLDIFDDGPADDTNKKGEEG